MLTSSRTPGVPPTCRAAAWRRSATSTASTAASARCSTGWSSAPASSACRRRWSPSSPTRSRSCARAGAACASPPTASASGCSRRPGSTCCWCSVSTPSSPRLPAEDFVREFLVDAAAGPRGLRRLAASRFGRGRERDLALLQRLGAELGFAAVGVAERDADGEPVSRAAHPRARPRGPGGARRPSCSAAPTRSPARVVRGDRMGKTLGWPTINVAAEDELAARRRGLRDAGLLPELPGALRRGDQHRHPADGLRELPAGGREPRPRLRADVYGERVELRFFKRLREERIFPSVMDLSAQIRRDVEATREYFAMLAALTGKPGAGRCRPPRKSEIRNDG